MVVSQFELIERDETSSEDEVQVYQTISNQLPPPNLLISKTTSIDIVVKSIYPQQFGQINPNLIFFFNSAAPEQKTYNIVISEKYPQSQQNVEMNETDKQMTLLDYYEENKQNLVYKRFKDFDLGKKPISSDKVYFSTILASLKKKSPKLIFRGDEIPSGNQECMQHGQIKFDSNFESGNLFCSFKKSEFEYDLILQNDINTRGNTQWFYFSVQGAQENETLYFNIMNHVKINKSTQNAVVCLMMDYSQQFTLQSAIVRMAQNGCVMVSMQSIPRASQLKQFKFFPQQSLKEYPINTKRKYYQLRFGYKFKKSDDKVFFAHSYPYTLTNLMSYFNRIFQNDQREQFISRKVLCYTMAGNPCDVLTITANNLNKRNYRKGVVFMARQHPGEPQGSYVMQGIIDFLTSNHPQAEFLRNNCIFKIFPMLNPDGVVMGNYRCGLEGNDLNRRWKNPNKKLHPTIYLAKKYIKGFSRERQILLVCDVHGHSRKQSTFVYGCAYSSQVKSIERVLALLMSKMNPNLSYPSCTFRIERAKDKTARIQLWRELKIKWVYTYECSFFGQEDKHYTIKDYFECGSSVCQALEQIVRDSARQKESNVSEESSEQIYL